MSRSAPGLVALAVATLLPAAARGGESPVIALHVKEATARGAAVCGGWAPDTTPCSKFNTAAGVGRACQVYLVAGRAEEVAAISCGIEYDGAPGRGVDVWGWTLCADLQFSNGDWPASGGGSRIVWDRVAHCQTSSVEDDGVHAIAGAFTVYAYSPDVLTVTPNMRIESGPELAIATCSASPVESDLPLDARGAVRFSESGDQAGYNPCSGVGEVPDPPSPPDPDPSLPPPASPSGDQEAAILLHLASGTGTPPSCDGGPSSLDDVVTSLPVPEGEGLYTVYLIATPGVVNGTNLGLGAAKLGVDLDVPAGSQGAEIQDWEGCGIGGFLRTDSWPQPGSGATLVWDRCQEGEIAVAGYFTVLVHGPAAMVLGEHPVSRTLEVASCAAGETVLAPMSPGRVGWVSLGGAAIGSDADGCNPSVEDCSRGATTVRPSTWGRLKSRY